MARSENPSVIVAGARTPIGKLFGTLKDFTAMDLGGFAIKAALERSGVTPDQVDYVIMGHVLQAGQGQMTARQAAVKGGISMSVPSLTINKVCLSGLNAIALADQLIRAGEVEVVVAGGMESMTNAPYLLPRARQGYRYGNAEILDATFHDGLFDAFDKVPMGEGTERHQANFAPMTREEQDEFAARSHELAAAAIKDGRFLQEIVPVTVPQRKGEPVVVSEDEGVRPGTTVESLAKLDPAFTKDGTISAGNASQISDGAAAVVVMSKAKAESLGLTWLAEIVSTASSRGPTTRCRSNPPTRSGRRSPERASRSGTSTCSSSTRPSQLSASPPPGRSVSTRTRSTSTAAPSPSATPSGPPALALSCTWRTS